MSMQKMSLANIKGALSRAEMKKIMAGSGYAGCKGIVTCQPSLGCGSIETGSCKCTKKGSDYVCV